MASAPGYELICYRDILSNDLTEFEPSASDGSDLEMAKKLMLDLLQPRWTIEDPGTFAEDLEAWKRMLDAWVPEAPVRRAMAAALRYYVDNAAASGAFDEAGPMVVATFGMARLAEEPPTVDLAGRIPDSEIRHRCGFSPGLLGSDSCGN